MPAMNPFKDPLSSLERILLTLWVGGIWAVGYLVTPVLFSSLDDRMLAGSIAGRLFGVMSLTGLLCGGLLLLAHLYRDRRSGLRDAYLWVLSVMLVVTAVGEFGIAPLMQQIKYQANGILMPGSDLHHQFGVLHAVSSTLFLVNSLLGLWLVIRRKAA
jgi:hypothetical protein